MKNFTKNIEVFDIKEAIDELTDILNDKIKMKNITLEVDLINFDSDNYLIKTDRKRL